MAFALPIGLFQFEIKLYWIFSCFCRSRLLLSILHFTEVSNWMFLFLLYYTDTRAVQRISVMFFCLSWNTVRRGLNQSGFWIGHLNWFMKIRHCLLSGSNLNILNYLNNMYLYLKQHWQLILDSEMLRKTVLTEMDRRIFRSKGLATRRIFSTGLETIAQSW